MARTRFVPPGPMPVPYRLADPVAQTAPERIDSADLASVILPEAPGRRRRSVDLQSPTVPKRPDRAARRERASANMERAARLLGRTVDYGRDTHDARFRERIAELAGVAAANAIHHLHPGDLAAVAACAVAGKLTHTARRALRRAIDRATRS